MYKYVNGQQVQLTDAEETNTLQFYALNQENPAYSAYLQFDGTNPPVYNIDGCKNVFLNNLNVAINNCISSINDQIEIAQENGDQVTVSSLYTQRKSVRELNSIDLSSIQTITDLMNMIPSGLGEYWPS